MSSCCPHQQGEPAAQPRCVSHPSAYLTQCERAACSVTSATQVSCGFLLWPNLAQNHVRKEILGNVVLA